MNSLFNNQAFIDSITPGIDTINQRTTQRNWTMGFCVLLGVIAIVYIKKDMDQKKSVNNAVMANINMVLEIPDESIQQRPDSNNYAHAYLNTVNG